GGHTAEMISMLDGMSSPREKYSPIVYGIGEDDKLSEPKIRKFQESRPELQYNIVKVKRARYVGQSYITSIFTSTHSLFSCFHVISSNPPKVLLLNGPGTCVPLVLVALAIRSVTRIRLRIIYIESFARVETLSLTGKILYNVADRFIVHWPELTEKYPKAEFLGFPLI
ncbi:beta-N-acetylglucosaminyltransferase, partial [Rozella allomycis CSF55]